MIKGLKRDYVCTNNELERVSFQCAQVDRATQLFGHSMNQLDPQLKKDCLPCRIIGTGALAFTGIYALNQARPNAPGSPLGKRLTAVTGIGDKCSLL